MPPRGSGRDLGRGRQNTKLAPEGVITRLHKPYNADTVCRKSDLNPPFKGARSEVLVAGYVGPDRSIRKKKGA